MFISLSNNDSRLLSEGAQKISPFRFAAPREEQTHNDQRSRAGQRQPRSRRTFGALVGFVLRSQTRFELRSQRLENGRIAIELRQRRAFQNMRAVYHFLQRRAQLARW